MQNKDFQDKMKAIQDKIGEEASGLILDEIGILLTDNLNMNKEIEAKNNEIAEQKARNEKLLEVNGNLLQQVSMAEEQAPARAQEQPKAETKPFDFRDAFDEFGNFKK